MKSQIQIALAVAALWAASATAAEFRQHPHRLAADVDAFHSVLAPVWHMPMGKERSRKACAQAGKMETTAGAIRSTDATQLIDSVSAFRAQCRANPAKVDEAFAQVHEAFHHLMEAAQ